MLDADGYVRAMGSAPQRRLSVATGYTIESIHNADDEHVGKGLVNKVSKQTPEGMYRILIVSSRSQCHQCKATRWPCFPSSRRSRRRTSFPCGAPVRGPSVVLPLYSVASPICT